MTEHSYHWLETGDAFYASVLKEIDRAERSVRLETYIFMKGEPGDAVRSALLGAAERGVRVRVLVDAFGSMELPSDYWAGVVAAGGACRVFNPLDLGRIAFRDHRKLLVCDDRAAFVSGFNISRHETGDGITRGWRDVGLKLNGPVVGDLAASFDRMFAMAEFKHRRLPRLRLPVRGRQHPSPRLSSPTLLNGGPGRAVNPIKRTLLRDLQQARSIHIISAYFLPTRRVLRALMHAARRGRQVTLITAGLTDVPLARYAGRSLYSRLLRAGVRIYEYEAQILHTKLIVAGDVVYVGSANLDIRSLTINYELLVRIESREQAEEAERIFGRHLPHCRPIRRAAWRASRGWWERILERMAHLLLARVDALFARRQLSRLR